MKTRGIMKTVEIDIDNSKDLEDIIRQFKKQNIKKGEKSTIQIKSSEHLNDLALAGILFLMVFALNKTFKQKQNIEFGDKLLKDIYKDLDLNQIEEHIKEEHGITFEIKDKVTTDPISQAFGIWKNKPVTLETIRNKAWLRKK
jgi:hypothetical protein